MVSAFVYREFDIVHVFTAAVETIKGTAAIMAIVAVAAMFGWILAVEQIPQWFNGWITGISTNPLSATADPQHHPADRRHVRRQHHGDAAARADHLPAGWSPSASTRSSCGLVVIFNLMIGLVTPPMGLSLFLMSDIAKVPMPAILKAMIPFYPPLLITLAIISLVPEVSLWIPRLMQ